MRIALLKCTLKNHYWILILIASSVCGSLTVDTQVRTVKKCEMRFATIAMTVCSTTKPVILNTEANYLTPTLDICDCKQCQLRRRRQTYQPQQHTYPSEPPACSAPYPAMGR